MLARQRNARTPRISLQGAKNVTCVSGIKCQPSLGKHDPLLALTTVDQVSSGLNILALLSGVLSVGWVMSLTRFQFVMRYQLAIVSQLTGFEKQNFIPFKLNYSALTARPDPRCP